MSKGLISLLLLTCLARTAFTHNLGDRVVMAVNCGGPETVGAYGIEYSADYSTDGTASDHGMQYSFHNAQPEDLDVYTTERWSSSSFSYEIPVGDGEYVIMLKFSEVYFQSAGQKVFHVRINSHTAVKNLDIFEAAGGRGFAHDIYVPVVVKGNSISVDGHSRSYDGYIEIEFAKGPHDNPKANGFAVVRGTIEDMPPVPQRVTTGPEDFESFDLYEEDDPEDSFRPQITRSDDDDGNVEMFSAGSDNNPYDKESNEWWLPVVAFLVVFIPIGYVIHLWNNPQQL
uniref:Malectin domain-containing protein n=1 Tax=Caenorhabditis japonica TaxID=281687 RepID=A0A8R1I201_CAEJA